MSERNGKQRVKRGDFVGLLEKLPNRYKTANYGGKKPNVGDILPVDGGMGTVVAIDETKKDSCIVDMELGKVMSNNMSDSIKLGLEMTDRLNELFGPMRIHPVKEMGSNGSQGKRMFVMAYDNLPFSIIGESSDECVQNLTQLVGKAKQLSDLAKDKQFKNYFSQFQK